MTVREKQSEFLQNVAKMILWAFDNGMELTGGELLRTNDQQLLYFEGYTLYKAGSAIHLGKAPRKSKTLASKHLDKLAIDLNVFIDGQYKTDKESYLKLGEYWENLNPENVWGGSWGWDANHFQMGR